MVCAIYLLCQALLHDLKDWVPNLHTPVDHKQKPMGISFVIVLPSSCCVKKILSGRTSLTREFVKTSTESCAKRDCKGN